MMLEEEKGRGMPGILSANLVRKTVREVVSVARSVCW